MNLVNAHRLLLEGGRQGEVTRRGNTDPSVPQGLPGAEIPLVIPERSESERRADSCAVALGKWRGKFAAMHEAEIH